MGARPRDVAGDAPLRGERGHELLHGELGLLLCPLHTSGALPTAIATTADAAAAARAATCRSTAVAASAARAAANAPAAAAPGASACSSASNTAQESSIASTVDSYARASQQRYWLLGQLRRGRQLPRLLWRGRCVLPRRHAA